MKGLCTTGGTWQQAGRRQRRQQEARGYGKRILGDVTFRRNVGLEHMRGEALQPGTNVRLGRLHQKAVIGHEWRASWCQTHIHNGVADHGDLLERREPPSTTWQGREKSRRHDKSTWELGADSFFLARSRNCSTAGASESERVWGILSL